MQVRFNLPNHFSPARGDRLTIWAVRFTTAAKDLRTYWGLGSEHAEEFLAAAEVRPRPEP